MRFYQELTLIKTPEITPYFIWSKLYTQVHLALVEQQNPDETVNLGVSFPEYKSFQKNEISHGTLGNKLRVFASSEQELQQLNLLKWLERLTDYVHIKSIQPVPAEIAEHVYVKRYRANTNMARLTRRFMRRESQKQGRELSFEEAKALQNQRFAKENKVSLADAEKHYQQPSTQEFPFIKLKSLSGDKDFSLQIEQLAANERKEGVFSTYGLSSQATVPHW